MPEGGVRGGSGGLPLARSVGWLVGRSVLSFYFSCSSAYPSEIYYRGKAIMPTHT